MLGDVIATEPIEPAFPVGAVFENAIELVGYDVSPTPAKRGEEVTVTFWWRSRAPVPDDWMVFVHLDDETRTVGRVIADHFPAMGRFRTPAWREGDVIRDEWRFSAPQGEIDGLALWTGFYRGETRLKVSSAGRGLRDGVNRVRAGVLSLE